MKSAAQNIIRPVPASDIAARVGAIDWAQATGELDAQGCAVLKGCSRRTNAARSRRSIPTTAISAAGS